MPGFQYRICLLFLFASTFLGAKNVKIRNTFDVLSYDIALQVIPEKKLIIGSNRIQARALKNLKSIELDLFPQMVISSVIYQGKQISIIRDSNSFVVLFPGKIHRSDTFSIEVNYSGIPIIAKKAPWDGGFVWEKDSSGSPWIGLACEGLGASCWLPCKDQWNDEPEQITLKLIVPQGLTGVSNGRLISKKNRVDSFTEFNWKVMSPINHYDISINIGDYAHFEDLYVNEKGERLPLDYYVLKANLIKAKTHFQQVKRMMKIFENLFGLYPFYRDGYKLVENPYWGMEHQSCVAYGNNYQNNKFGFDFIIIHESGHEWFANSITAADRGDMWIHESFTTYSEALFVEKQFGLHRSLQYLAGQKGNIKNEVPVVGPHGVNYKFNDNDIYYKGAWILHTMRNILDNDTLWFNTLFDLSQVFRHKIVSSKEIESFLIHRTGTNFEPFFKQYLYHSKLPELQYYIIQKDGLNELHYRLHTDVRKLKLPIRATLTKDKFDFLIFEKNWKIYDLPYTDSHEFKLDDKHFLFTVKKELDQTKSKK